MPSAQNNLYPKVGYFVLQWYIPVPSTTISQPDLVSEFQHEIFLSDEQGPLSQSVALETLSHLETLKPLLLSFQVDRRERGQEPTIRGCKISTLLRIFAKSKRLWHCLTLTSSPPGAIVVFWNWGLNASPSRMGYSDYQPCKGAKGLHSLPPASQWAVAQSRSCRITAPPAHAPPTSASISLHQEAGPLTLYISLHLI